MRGRRFINLVGGKARPIGFEAFKAAIAGVKAGAGRGNVVIITDSTGAGAGAGTSGTSLMNGAATRSWPQGLQKFAGSPIYLSSNSWWATNGYDGAAGITLGGFDTRLVQGANWAPNLTSLGGKVIRYAPGAVNNFSFTPTYAFDTFVPHFLKNNGNGTCTANVDGGASLGTINTNSGGALVWAKQIFTCAKGVHQINLVPNNDAQMFFGGIVAYDSTQPGLDVINAAVYGATAATFIPAVNVYDAINSLKFLAPVLTIICLTINDSNNGTVLATWLANLQIAITAAKISGSVLLMVGPPSNTTQATDGTLDGFVTALNGLAATNNCSVLDMKKTWGSYANIQPTFPYADALHVMQAGYQGPPANGYPDIDTAVAAMLMAA